MVGGLTRRQFLLLAAAAPVTLAACGGLAASASPSSARGFAGASMAVHMAPLLHSTPAILAGELGFYKDEGLTVELEVANNQIDTEVQLLSGGKLDCFMGNTDASLNNALVRGAPIKAISAVEIGRKGYHYTGLLVSDKLWQAGVRTPEDLKTHRQIAVEMSVAMGLKNTSGRKYYRFMKFHGFDPLKDFDIKEWTNPAPIIQSFQAGQIDILFSGEPRMAVLEDAVNAHVLGWDTDAPDIEGEPALMVTVNEEWLKKDPERGVRFAKAYLRGIQTYAELLANGWKDAKLRQIVARAIQTPEKLFDRLGGPYVPGDGLAALDRIDAAIAFFKTTVPVITGDTVPASKFVDFSYVREAASRLGIKP